MEHFLDSEALEENLVKSLFTATRSGIKLLKAEHKNVSAGPAQSVEGGSTRDTAEFLFTDDRAAGAFYLRNIYIINKDSYLTLILT